MNSRIFYILMILLLLAGINTSGLQYPSLSELNNSFDSDDVPISPSQDYITRGGITITSDSQLDIEFPGAGTALSPYIIEGYKISGSTSESLIDISGTTAHFIIRNNYLVNGKDGIFLINVINGQIYNNTIVNFSYTGIYLISSSQNIISNNTLTSSRCGITLQTSSENEIINNTAALNDIAGIYVFESSLNSFSRNTVTENKYAGISILYSSENIFINNTVSENRDNGFDLLESSNNAITNNTIVNNLYKGIYFELSPQNTIINNTIETSGIFLEGNSILDILQTKVEGNNYQGKNIVFLQNEHDLVVPPNTGRVILINCTNIEIRDQIISSGYYGIQSLYSNFTSIIQNTVFDNRYGIYLSYSHNSTISHNNVENNSEGGIISDHSENTLMEQNIVTNNSWNGIELSYSNNNVLDANTITNNSYGIYLLDAYQNAIINNIILNELGNGNAGIYLEISQDNNIEYNEITSSANGIAFEYSPNNIVLNNNLYLNGLDFEGDTLEQLIQTEVSNNMINNKLLIYLHNMHNYKVPDYSGQVILMNCTNIEISNQELTYASNGIQIFYSNNTLISQNTIDNNYFGMTIWKSDEIIIRQNTVSYNLIGIYLVYSNDSLFEENTLSNNTMFGIMMAALSNSSISENVISNNSMYGLYLEYAHDNEITYNNFINNGVQAYDDNFGENVSFYSNNYWSDWVQPDNDGDGIVDDPYLYTYINDSSPMVSPNKDIISPSLSSANDISFEDGAIGISISWYVGDASPGLYEVKLNGDSFIGKTKWQNGMITVILDGMSVGNHTLELFVYDLFGNVVYDSIKISVTGSSIITNDPITPTDNMDTTTPMATDVISDITPFSFNNPMPVSPFVIPILILFAILPITRKENKK